jgi:hypothetical protein
MFMARDIARSISYPIAHHQERQSLVDEIFIKLCDMVNDPMVQVRETTCRELGKFRSIKSELLCQTFSKDFISNRKSHRNGGKYAKVSRNYSYSFNTSRWLELY